MDEFIRRAKRYQKDLLAPYGGWQYMPMGNARALMVPVTRGCSYNACVFCALNKYPFFAFPMTQIEENIKKLAFIHSRDRKPPRQAVLLQGNPWALSTHKLLQIAEMLKTWIPSIEEISGFARADDVLAKSPADLFRLRQAGYAHLTLGVESGSDAVLSLQNKGISRQEQIQAMEMLDQAGINYDCYVMLGLGGKELSADHVEATASLINAVKVQMLIVVTTVLFPDAKLVDLVRAGTFTRLSPKESMEEMFQLLALLEGPLIFNASHKTNLFALKGKVPEQKDDLMAKLQTLLDQHQVRGQGLRENQRWRRFSTEQ
ncbi:MAG: radical SAM protein [Eubacteriales bacterium]|nr:radical SAM protein [Clostridiales bacterium]MDY5836077.1 radical SAM protein [Eubacteriales bacterium]